MKALGYLVVFFALVLGCRYLANAASQDNVELALVFGMLIPVIMCFVAMFNGDLE